MSNAQADKDLDKVDRQFQLGKAVSALINLFKEMETWWKGGAVPFIINPKP